MWKKTITYDVKGVEAIVTYLWKFPYNDIADVINYLQSKWTINENNWQDIEEIQSWSENTSWTWNWVKG